MIKTKCCIFSSPGGMEADGVELAEEVGVGVVEAAAAGVVGTGSAGAVDGLD
jgi:hypothetical protein